MTSEITRRAALSLVGAGTTVFLSACAATNVFVGTQEDASSPSASPKDYKGEAKLEEYDTSAGTFEPATHDTPPKNVPKPIKPKNACISWGGYYLRLYYGGYHIYAGLGVQRGNKERDNKQ